MARKHSMSIIKRGMEPGAMRLRAVVGGVILLALLLTAGSEREQAAGAAPVAASLSASALAPAGSAADPDLCALLPSGAGWTVISSNRSQSCRVSNPEGDIKEIVIEKFGSPAEARAELKRRFDAATRNNFGRWDASASYGDPGNGYDIIPINLNDPGGAFARGCYVAVGTGRRSPADPETVRTRLKSVDAELAKAPCGGTTTPPPPTTGPIAGAPVRATIKGLRNSSWFGGAEPVIVRASNGTTVKAVEGMQLYDADTIRSSDFTVTLSWSRGADKEPATINVGPDSIVRVRPLNERQSVPLMELLRGFATFFFPKGDYVDFKFQASTHTIVAAIKGTTFTLGYDEKTQTSTVQVTEGSVEIVPTNTALQSVTITAGTQVQVSPTSVGPVMPYVPLPGSSGRLTPETGRLMGGLFFEYWFTHGGLAQQGYPISDALREVSDLNGQTYTVQYFERAVFEYHPEFQPPNDILLSQLGTFQYRRKYPQGAPSQRPNTSAGSRLFTETGKRVGGKFLDYWNKNGGLAQQGLPLSEEFTEISDTDGRPYTVQYFERAVFEYHPELAAPNDVLLSLLGAFTHKQKYGGGTGNPPPPPPPGATATPVTAGTSGPCSDTLNIASASNGGSIAGVSSDHGAGWTPNRIIDGDLNTGWASAMDSITNQYVIVALPRGQTYNVNKVRINPWNTAPSCCPTDAMKDFEIRVSTTDTNPASFRTVHRGTTPMQLAFFDFTFSAAQAKYVMLFVINNHGGRWIEVKEFEVYATCSGGPPPPQPTPTRAAGQPQPTSTPPSGGGACADVPASVNMNVRPSNCGKAGTSFAFEGFGFNPGERVGIYATGPDGNVVGAPFQVTADANGALTGQNGVTLQTSTNSPQGIWAMSMEGVTSRKKAIGYIRLLPP